MIDRQSCHSNVDWRFGWIAIGVVPQDRQILQRGFGK
jgi:hypothetical protein